MSTHWYAREARTGARRMRRLAAPAMAAAAAAAGTCAGCNSIQKNQWYFAAAQVPAVRIEQGRGNEPDRISVDDVKLKFYRVTVEGWSVNADAQLLTGVYPAKPLHDLFGDVNRPEDQKKSGDGKDSPHDAGQTGLSNMPAGPVGTASSAIEAGNAAGPHDDDDARSVNDVMLFECDQEFGRLRLIPQDARFTIFYGANADAIADQVKQFAEADDTGTLMGRLLLAASGAANRSSPPTRPRKPAAS